VENIGVRVCALKFGVARCRVQLWKNIGVWVCALKFGTVQCRVVMREKYWRGCAHLNLALRGAEW
jgi:hypothetical protein